MRKEFRKSLLKYQVAELLGISASTLSHYLNNKYYDELARLGYEKNQKILTPRILNYLSDRIGLTNDEEENY